MTSLLGLVVVVSAAALTAPARAQHQPGHGGTPTSSPSPSATSPAPGPAPTALAAVGRSSYGYDWYTGRRWNDYWLRGRVVSAGGTQVGAGVAGVKVIVHAPGPYPYSVGQKFQTEVITDEEGWFTAWMPNGDLALVGWDVRLLWSARTQATAEYASSSARGVLIQTAGYDVQP